MRRNLALLGAAVFLTACQSEPPPPERSNAEIRADTVAIAAQTFDASAFDTITWEDPAVALDRGSVVFTISCAKCHGESGRGNAGFVYRGVTLQPPSFLAEDWRFADDPMGLREQIFVGNAAGMPYWGLVGLKYRDIDAVSVFITDFLRENYSNN